MKKSVFVLLVVAISFATACSQSSSESKSGKIEVAAASGKTDAEAMQVDYKKVCERLIPLSPEARRDSFSKTCESTYQKYLPSCRNSSTVTECYMKIKSWDERLACFDVCVRDTVPAK
ncbi:MAG: hypothetical protein M0Q22_04930 [Sulfuritalea sp.]|jgi:hypothetical protein|nr:hypothetical protein [Sulfuritalea sp.]